VYRTIKYAAIAASFGLLAACTCPPFCPPKTPAPPTAPEINGFATVSHRTVAPAPVAVTFQMTDVNGGPITCVLEGGPAGEQPRTIPDCEHRVAEEYDMPFAETDSWTLTATDSTGLTTSATTHLTLEANPDPSDHFNITLRFAPGLPDWQIAAAQQAAANWEWALRSGLPSAHLALDGNTLGGLLSGNGLAGPFDGEVDDVMIDVGPVPTTNGRGAYGMSDVQRADGTTVYGVIAIGNNDFDWNTYRPWMSTVLTHEMGHVLGIGNGDHWWNHSYIAGDYPKLRFMGPNAAAEVPDNFDATQGIPLVDTGLPIGDIGAHPKWSVTDRSWSNQNFATTDIMANCWGYFGISRLSLGFLRDLGYDTTPDWAVGRLAYNPA